MPDLYTQVVTAPVARDLAKRLGLPTPVELRRYQPGQPLIDGPVLLRGTPGSRLIDAVTDALHGIPADVRTDATPDAASSGPREQFAAVILDATGITDSSQLRLVYEFFHPAIRQMGPSSRLLVLATPPEACKDAREATAQRALEGFVRSAAKEMRGGATANLIEVDPGAEAGIESTLRFFLSGRSAYVSGQAARVGPADDETPEEPDNWDQPLTGRVAVVTGAAQGIGAAIVEVLARDGAHVICLDLPSQGDALSQVANRVGGSSLQLDITADDAPRELAEYLTERHGGVDIVIHNAGITRDKTLAGMDEGRWDAVLDINLSSQERINDALLAGDILHEGGRIVSVSSLSGIAGNRGQTNYAASKAGVIGMVEAMAPTLAGRKATINAVAPGFIETAMTAQMPVGTREAGRRMNSVSQGGKPVDVAETIAWLAHPGSAWVNGRVMRVCGQSLLGA